MNGITNIWNHPKTSVAGLLIAVVTIAGVLSQQGITLGAAGKGSVVTLLGAIASALLGLLAKDPGNATSRQSGAAAASQQAKLGAWALIALLLPLPWMSGCSQTTVAQDIVNWTPALQSAVATVDSSAGLLAPTDAQVFTTATAGFDAASNLLTTQARAYLANPSASMFAQMQSQIVVLQQQVNAALLQAARIENPASQQHALLAIQAVGTVVTAILGLIQSVSSKTAVAQMSAGATVKMASVLPLINNDEANDEAADMVAVHYGERVELARAQVVQVEQAEMAAGF